MVLQWCYSGVTLVLQWCYSGVTLLQQTAHRSEEEAHGNGDRIHELEGENLQQQRVLLQTNVQLDIDC